MANNSVASCLFLLSLDSNLMHSESINTIIVSTITSILAVTATVSNSLALYVFYRITRLRTLANMLLMSLCVTDLLTGVIVQPFFVIRRLHELNPQNNICTIRLIYIFFASLCAGASLLTLGLVTIDRCTAIVMPYRYLSTASYKLYITVTILVWLAWAIFVSLPFIGVLSTMQYNVGLSTIYLLVILVVLISYCRIHRIVIEQRRKIVAVSNWSEPTTVMQNNASNVLVEAWKNVSVREVGTSVNESVSQAREGTSNNIRNEGASDERMAKENQGSCRNSIPLQFIKNERGSNADNSDDTHLKVNQDATISSKRSAFQNADCLSSGSRRQRKNIMQRLRGFKNEQRQANTIAIIVVTLMLCYLPQIVLLTIRASMGDSRDLLNVDAWADLLVFLNSSLNPLIYCLRNKEMRSAFKSLFKRSR